MLEWLRTGKRADRQQGNGEWTECLTEVDSDRSRGNPAGTGRTVQGSSNLAAGTGRAVQGSSNLAAGTGRTVQGSSNLAAGTDRTVQGSSNLAAGTGRTVQGSSNLAAGTGRAVQASPDLVPGAGRPAQASPDFAPGAGRATQAMADLATEAWRFSRVAERCAMNMDIMDADRFLNQYDWFARKIQAVTQEAGLWTVDLTGQVYEPGMAVSPLNLEDFPEGTPLVIAQMVEPVLMENGNVRKMGTAMLDFQPEQDDDV